ncbi:MAG: hypothetical protein DIU71_13560 [Proteobacteria bacterium]|nr:MAG: hypothetical protein DIU71_13560 [Pseudomonadota bacterium]
MRVLEQVFAFGRPAAALGCTLFLAACGASKPCIDPGEPYLQAREHPPLRVPEGLSAPNRAGALTIPQASGGSAPAPTRTARRDGCLTDPPSYFRSADTFARTPEEVVVGWAQAWAEREVDAVLALYSQSFEAPTDATGSAEWLEQRREQVGTGPAPDPVIADLRVLSDGEDRRIATFVQRFGTNALRKELVLVREAGSWRIVAERVLEVQ